MKRTFLFVVAALFAITTYNSTAQEVKAVVTVNMDQLTFEARNHVSSMKSDLESYINNQRFTNMEWEGDPIDVVIQIYLTGGNNNNYSGRFIMIVNRALDGPDEGRSPNLKIIDQQWAFEYARGANLTYNNRRFDHFTTLIDYYMLLAIGYDSDTYEELGGNIAYSKAKDLVLLGASQNAAGYDTYASTGEFTKYNLVRELTDIRFDELRQIFFSYYVDGLDMMAFDKDKALTALKVAIHDMAEFKRNKLSGPSVVIQAFMDTHKQEIASIFNGEEDSILWSDLNYIDPSSSLLFNDAMEGNLR